MYAKFNILSATALKFVIICGYGGTIGREGRVFSDGEVTVDGGNFGAWSNTCPRIALSTKHPTRTALVMV
jgi:hypothetical protein